MKYVLRRAAQFDPVWHGLSRRLAAASHRTVARVIQLTEWSRRNESRFVSVWIMAVIVVAGIKAATAPTPAKSLLQAVAMSLPFLLVAAAPVAGYRIGQRAFATPPAMQQPGLRLARYGNWRPASSDELAEVERTPAGLVWFSLVSGILFNVPVRALEYLASIPAVSPSDPTWAHVVVQSFTLDCVVMCFIYSACFASAVRGSPLFARFMVAAWLADVAMQGVIATQVGKAGLPRELIEPLVTLLQANVQKVAISATIWLPYLLLSETVNLRLRHRVRLART